MKNIEAIFFDMDGLMMDSEPLWREAEVEVLNTYGVPLTVEKARETMGLRIEEVMEYWYKQYPWKEKSKDEVADEIMDKVVESIEKKGQAQPGLDTALEQAKKMNVPLALVSSSAVRIIDAVLKKLQLENTFVKVYSAQNEPFGKPHPGVYLTAVQGLNVSPEHCIALEDSLNGVISAKSAKIKCIAVPDSVDRKKKEFGVADVVLDSLEQVDQELFKGVMR